MKLFTNRRIKILLYSIYIILIDQTSKFLVLNILGFQKSVNIIPNLISLTLVKNKGAAFSIFSNSTTLLTLASILASLILITIILRFPPRSYWNAIGLAYLLGGTLGNGIDRFFRGYVLDFLNLYTINFPIFNVADISINIALICFIIDTIKTKDKSKIKY
tara:strand:- start:694 stop:1176 length:483 start_codon:yes stop_codon:yes gene_type:complete